MSCVTGGGLDLVKQFLKILPPVTPTSERERLAQDMTEFQIDELFSIPGTGTVAGGVIQRSVAVSRSYKVYSRTSNSYRYWVIYNSVGHTGQRSVGYIKITGHVDASGVKNLQYLHTDLLCGVEFLFNSAIFCSPFFLHLLKNDFHRKLFKSSSCIYFYLLRGKHTYLSIFYHNFYDCVIINYID